MATKIYFRRGTKAELDAIILDAGEPGWTTDTDELYMGDGTTSGGIFIAGGVGGVDTLNALVGAVTVDGAGTITVSENGQVITISGAEGIDVDSLNSITGAVSLIGGGNVAVTENGQVITVSGVESADVDSLNALTGDVIISGAGTVTVTENGQVVVISGAAGAGDDEFTDHSDTPNDYSGAAKKIVVVNAGASALEFSNVFNVESALAADEDYSGMVCSGIAGEVVVFADSVYFNSAGKWAKTIATVEGQTKGHIGLVTVSGAADAAIEVLLAGFMREDDWTWGTVGAELWLATTSGDLSETAPTASGEFVRKVAVTHGANVVWFNPGMSPVIKRSA